MKTIHFKTFAIITLFALPASLYPNLCPTILPLLKSLLPKQLTPKTESHTDHIDLFNEELTYNNKIFTATTLYDDFAHRAYQRLASLGPHYPELLLQPTITHRLTEFINYAKQNPYINYKAQAAQFIQQLGPYPEPPKSHGNSPFLGDYPEANAENLRYVEKNMLQHGLDIIEMDIPLGGTVTTRSFLVVNLDLIKEILTDTSGTYIKGDPEQRAQKLIFPPEGIVFMYADDRWKLLNQALFAGPFNPKEFPNRYGNIFAQNAIWLTNRWQQKTEPFDLYQETTYYTMRTMAQALFDYVLNDNELTGVTDAFRYMLNFMRDRETSLINIPLFLPTHGNSEFKRHSTTFTTVLKSIISQAPHTIEVNGTQYPTIISILKEHRDPNTGIKLTEQEIISHVATIFFAGHDTTANFVTMLLYHLNKNTTYSQKILEEIEVTLQDRSEEWFTMGALTEYTKFKNEVLRLYPSVPMISVNTTKETKLGTYTLPKNSLIYIILSAASTNPLHFKNPQTFNPDRFEPDNQDHTPSTNQNTLPFSFGRRRCLGQWFAQAEARNLIAHFLQEKITLDLINDLDEIKIYADVTGRPHRTIWAQANIPTSKQQKSNYHIKDVPLTITKITNTNQTGSIKTFRFAATNGEQLPFDYHPGDHIEIFAKDSYGKSVLRHFSFSSSPTDSNEWIEITTKNEPGGIASGILHKQAKIGDTFIVRAAMDDGVRVSEHYPVNRPLVLISGGIGITPMISITRYLLAKNWPGQLYFVHSSTTPKETAFYDELINLEKEYANFHLTVTMTRLTENHNWTGDTGRINQICFEQIPNIDQAQIYLCGKQTMCSSLSSLLQKTFSMPTDAIHHLSFGAIDWKKIAQKTFTLKQVAWHNSVNDGWIVIDNIVYDITHYIDQHPGMDVIIDYLGQDATEVFNNIPHSAQAKKLLSESELITIKGILK